MNEDLRAAIVAEAQRIGANPLDLATVISYETGGTFDAWKAGPKTQWGRHVGLIQMGEPQRAKYGYTSDKDIAGLVKASADYLVDNGFEPGMGLLDMYSTINAGAPGRYDASDATNGGAPGTVRDKVATMAGHQANAEKLLGGTWQEISNSNPSNNYTDLQLPEDKTAMPPSLPVPDVTPQNPMMPETTNTYAQDYGDGLFNRQPVTAGVAYIQEKNARAAAGLAPEASYTEGLKAAVESGWFIPQWSAMGDHAPDPDFTMTPELLKNLTQGIDPSYHYLFEDAHSKAHAMSIRDYAVRQAQLDQTIGELGWKGTAMQIGVELLDPVTLFASVASEGIMAPLAYGRKLSRAGRILNTALVSGTSNLAAEAALSTVNPKIRSEDLAIAFGFGAVAGGALGALTRGGNRTGDVALHAVGEKLTGTPTLSLDSAGAARNTSYNQLFANLTEMEWDDLGKESVGRKIGNVIQMNPLTKTGIDRAEQATPEAFLAMRELGEDARGARGDEVVGIAASLRAHRMWRSTVAQWQESWVPAYKAWAKDQGVAGWKRKLGLDDTQLNQFFNEVAQYVENRDTMRSFHPSVEQAGRKFRDIMGHYADVANNPGLTYGETYRSVAGFQSVKPDQFYLPKYADHHTIQSMVKEFGKEQMVRFVREAIRVAAPDMSDRTSRAIADGYLKRLLGVGLGIQDDFAQVMGRADIDEITNFLKNELGVSDNETIAEFMDLTGITKVTTGPAKSPTGRGMRRTPIDYNFKLKMTSRAGEEKLVSMRDFFKRDADFIMQRYAREMSGHIALAQIKIIDPKTGLPVEGLDGITSKAEWQKMKEWVKKSMANSEMTGDEIRAMDEEMDYLYDAIVGNPHNKNPNNAALKALRRVMAFNFVRTMQNMGIAQAQEITNILANTGLKAFTQGIPAFGRILRGGKSIRKDEVVQELMAATGEGYDAFIGGYRNRFNWDTIGEGMGGKIGAGVDFGLQKGKTVVSNLSLMKHVNTVLHQWGMRAIAQKFANLAFEHADAIRAGTFKATDIDSIFIKDAKRLRAIGLGDDQLVRIFKNILDHADGAATGSRLTKLNFEKWDVLARAEFLDSLDAWLGRTIQRNDPASLAKWLSSPVSQMFFQFRSFVLGAWTKQTLYGINHFDARTVATWGLQMMAGAGTYALTAKALSLGQQDPDKYMEDRLGNISEGEWGKLAAAGLSRAGFTSLVPMVWDTGSYITGGPRLDYRTSQISTALWGNPTADFATNVIDFMRDGIESVKSGREQSQQELRNSLRTFVGNWIPLQVFFSSMIQDRPQKKPRELQ